MVSRREIRDTRKHLTHSRRGGRLNAIRLSTWSVSRLWEAWVRGNEHACLHELAVCSTSFVRTAGQRHGADLARPIRKKAREKAWAKKLRIIKIPFSSGRYKIECQHICIPPFRCGGRRRWSYLRVLDRKKLLRSADLAGKRDKGGGRGGGAGGGGGGWGGGKIRRISSGRKKRRTLAKPAAHTNRATAA